MKNTTKCPKCGSSEVYQVPFRKNLDGGAVGVGILAVVPVYRYICTDCGFLEEWILEKEELADIKQYAKDKGWKKGNGF